MIISKPLGSSTHSRKARNLYRTAFPKEEQLPWLLLRFMTALRLAQLNCYERDGVFCGLTVISSTPKVRFVMFLAVEEALRGTGCGSEILAQLKGKRPVILNVEPLDDQAQNAAQRVLRMRFYEKNGFYDTGYEIDEVGGTFRVLSTEPKLDVPSYSEVFGKMSFGFWRPEIREVEK